MQGRLLGEHPQGGAITVRQGRFGPYVSHGKTSATLKRDMSPDDLTLEEAIRLIEDKEGAGSPKRPSAKAGKVTARKAPPKAIAGKSGSGAARGVVKPAAVAKTAAGKPAVKTVRKSKA